MDHENAFKQWKRQCFSKVDFSKKGNIDDEIYPVVCLINDSSNYFTTSSCSGRIILIDGVLGLQKASGNAVFKFEPFVLHVQCKDIESAKLLHSVAVNSGFRNSGMSIGKRGKIIMAVRSTHCLEVPLSHKGEILVNENYIHFLVQTANQKMAENVTRIKRFYDGLQAVLQADGSSSMATCKDKTTKIVQNQHQRKTQDSVIEDSQIPANKFSDSEDYLETSLILFS
ncbi:tRNA wybutosine-synthesizing protein 3 homolog isoform X2 [Alosa alosa]|uniref:tRNA wybutosine-synthesizing protein 3 homolog isoform X2 n=1 Tax=Alosa alosa TaxID=278164 RepID=UPI002015364D|nr:tRNA wybutosine-synthesizing protein 3 homolog isoform X2 [Alosa alosa]